MAVSSGQWARAQVRHGLSGGRSQLGLAFVGTVQLLVLLEVALRVAGGHAIVPTVALLLLALGVSALAATAPTRACATCRFGRDRRGGQEPLAVRSAASLTRVGVSGRAQGTVIAGHGQR